MVSPAIYTTLVPQAATPVTILPSSPQASQPPNSTDGSQSHGEIGRWATFVSQVSEIVASNQGLLLVAASQFFFALMNLMVKKLNSLDPPVSALEVFVQTSRDNVKWIYESLFVTLVGGRSNGKCVGVLL